MNLKTDEKWFPIQRKEFQNENLEDWGREETGEKKKKKKNIEILMKKKFQVEMNSKLKGKNLDK